MAARKLKEQAANSAKYYYYSASQLDKFALCNRKWAWEYLAGHREPAGPAAELGTRVHKVLEKWLSKATPINLRTTEGKIAAPGLDELPLPSPRLEVEDSFQIRIGKFHYRGQIDLSYRSKQGPWVVDHKTTGDFIWQKTEKVLRTDIQAILYAKVALDKYPDAEFVYLKWVYYRTRKPAVRVTKLKLSRDYVEKEFEKIEALTREADRYRLNVVNPMDVPFNPKACGAFGGCPHVKRCGLKPIERMKARMAQEAKKQTLAEKMKDRNRNRRAKPKRVSAKPEINPPEQPDEEEQLSTEPAEVPARSNSKKAAKKKTTAKKGTKKKAPPRRGREEEEDLDEDDDDLEDELDEDEPDDEDEEEESEDDDDDEEEEQPKRRGRPKGSKTKKAAPSKKEESSGSADVDVRTQQIVLGILYAGALAGGGHPALFEKADALFEENFK